MERLKRLIREIHRRSLWQVLAIYVGASWVVFEIVQTVTEGLGLPEWFPPFAALLLLIGLPIVLATAFVQEGVTPINRTDPTLIPEPGRTRAAELPENEDGLRQLLTWRNALLAVFLAFSLWGVVATGWLLLPDRGRTERDAAPRIESLVVLPLDNLTGDSGQDYFVDGMHEALTAELSKISALKVISRTSAMHYKGVKQPLPKIASELGVDGVIEGSVAREGDQVRITVQLIHGPSDEHLWTDTYQRELRSVLALQSEVARAIAEQIEVTVTPQEEARLASVRPVGPDAYKDYLRGRYHYNRYIQNAFTLARDYFQDATQKDPNYAEAYAGLALSYFALGFYGRIPHDDALSKARAAILKSLEIDENTFEAYEALGYIKTYHDWDWTEAERAYLRAIELNPGSASAHSQYAELLVGLGRFDEGLREHKIALTLDPLSVLLHAQLGARYVDARRYQLAIQQYTTTLDMDSNFVHAHYGLGQAYAELGRFKEAIAELRKAVTLSGGAPIRRAALGWVLAAAGEAEEARSIVAVLEGASVSPVLLARIYGYLGETDRAFQLLERAYEERRPYMFWLKVGEGWSALRSDLRFQALLRRMKFPE